MSARVTDSMIALENDERSLALEIGGNLSEERFSPKPLSKDFYSLTQTRKSVLLYKNTAPR